MTPSVRKISLILKMLESVFTSESSFITSQLKLWLDIDPFTPGY